MKRMFLFVGLCTAVMNGAQAEIYKNVDAYGHVTYSSTPSKGAKKLDLDRLPVTSREATRNKASPPDFPRIDSGTQRNRDLTRRRILENELAMEEKLLGEAQSSLQDGLSRQQTDPALRDPQNLGKHEETLKYLREQVALHESNIKALKTELASSK